MTSHLFKLTPESEKGVSCIMTQGQSIQAERGCKAKWLDVSLMGLRNNRGVGWAWLSLVHV